MSSQEHEGASLEVASAAVVLQLAQIGEIEAGCEVADLSQRRVSVSGISEVMSDSCPREYSLLIFTGRALKTYLRSKSTALLCVVHLE